MRKNGGVHNTPTFANRGIANHNMTRDTCIGVIWHGQGFDWKVGSVCTSRVFAPGIESRLWVYEYNSLSGPVEIREKLWGIRENQGKIREF